MHLLERMQSKLSEYHWNHGRRWQAHGVELGACLNGANYSIGHFRELQQELPNITGGVILCAVLLVSAVFFRCLPTCTRFLSLLFYHFQKQGIKPHHSTSEAQVCNLDDAIEELEGGRQLRLGTGFLAGDLRSYYAEDKDGRY